MTKSIMNGPVKVAVTLTSVLILSSLAACSKGNNNPANWSPDTKMIDSCRSPRAFNIRSVSESRSNKLKDTSLSDRLVVRTYLVPEVQANSLASDVVVSEKSAVDFESSSDQIEITTNCNELSGTFKGFRVATDAEGNSSRVLIDVEGKLTEISTKSIAISGVDKTTNEDVTVSVVKVIPDRKSDAAAYAIAMDKESQGYSTLIITLTPKSGQKLVLKQETTLSATPSATSSATPSENLNAKQNFEQTDIRKQLEDKINEKILVVYEKDLAEQTEAMSPDEKLDAAQNAFEADLKALAAEEDAKLEQEATAGVVAPTAGTAEKTESSPATATSADAVKTRVEPILSTFPGI